VSGAIRLMIVDDHPVVRDGLSGMFSADQEFEVIGEAGNGADAVRRARALKPGCDPDGPADAELDGSARSERSPPKTFPCAYSY
jgi:chemotaxis response regulator CheB